MRSRFSLLFLIGAMPWALVHAADLSGTWQYEKAADYSGRLKNIPPPRFPTLQIANGKLTLSPNCVVWRRAAGTRAIGLARVARRRIATRSPASACLLLSQNVALRLFSVGEKILAWVS